MRASSWRRPARLLAGVAAAALLAGPPAGRAGAESAVLADCPPAEAADLERAIAAGRDLARGAADYLEGVAETQRRFDAPYQTWFGSYDAWRYGRVIANYRAIADALAPGATDFRCGCPPVATGLETEVEQGTGRGIAVCKSFWMAPEKGGRSRAGALVEAASRLPGAGGARLLAPSQIQSTTLAGQRPEDAIRNAPTYRFFAEEEKSAGLVLLPGALALVLVILLGARFRRAGRAR